MMFASKRYAIVLLTVLLLVAGFGIRTVCAHDGETSAVTTGDEWMNGYTLFLTNAKNISQAYEAAEAVSRAGGHIGVIIPNEVMLGWVPADKIKGLVGKTHIRQIYQKALSHSARNAALADLSVPARNSEAITNAVTFFSDVASGRYKSKKDAAKARMEASGVQPQMLPDAFDAPPISRDDYMANLEANGITEETLRNDGVFLGESVPGVAAPSPGNSDYMAGKVLFNAIFVESKGGIDANSYTWKTADRATMQSEIVSGLSWWASTAQSSVYNVPLTFIYRYLYSTSTQTGYEPIKHPHTADNLWINQIMANLGYSSGDKFARTAAYNTVMRASFLTNWSVVSFIAYNPSPAATKFTDGYFAYSYIRGPYSQLCFRNDGWGTASYDIVNAHETGHLFGAWDEYYQAGYGGCGATDCTTHAVNYVYNGNCVRCNANSIPCMMKGNTQSLCGYTPGQIGWTGIQSPVLRTAATSGVTKSFFAPGEAVQYRLTYCVAGPRVGTSTLGVRSRVSVDYFGGSPGASTSVSQNSAWMSSGSLSPPTSTGTSCYTTWVNWTIPSTVVQGPANASMQLEVVGMGKGVSSTANSIRFYVSDGATKTQISSSASSIVPEDSLPQSSSTVPYLDK
jgi:hypothetical protein